jgi:hypothetical protein
MYDENYDFSKVRIGSGLFIPEYADPTINYAKELVLSFGPDSTVGM